MSTAPRAGRVPPRCAPPLGRLPGSPRRPCGTGSGPNNGPCDPLSRVEPILDGTAELRRLCQGARVGSNRSVSCRPSTHEDRSVLVPGPVGPYAGRSPLRGTGPARRGRTVGHDRRRWSPGSAGGTWGPLPAITFGMAGPVCWTAVRALVLTVVGGDGPMAGTLPVRVNPEVSSEGPHRAPTHPDHR